MVESRAASTPVKVLTSEHRSVKVVSARLVSSMTSKSDFVIWIKGASSCQLFALASCFLIICRKVGEREVISQVVWKVQRS